MEKWIDHDGQNVPVPAGTRVRARYRDGAVTPWFTVSGTAPRKVRRGAVLYNSWLWGALPRNPKPGMLAKKIVSYMIKGEVEKSAELSALFDQWRLHPYSKVKGPEGPLRLPRKVKEAAQ